MFFFVDGSQAVVRWGQDFDYICVYIYGACCSKLMNNFPQMLNLKFLISGIQQFYLKINHKLAWYLIAKKLKKMFIFEFFYQIFNLPLSF